MKLNNEKKLLNINNDLKYKYFNDSYNLKN